MAVTYVSVRRAACALGEGHERPSVKVALQAAILSAQESLERNAREMQVLRERGWLIELPDDHEQVWQALKGLGHVTRTKVEGLYWAEKLDKAGLLKGLGCIGTGYEQQSAWREQVYRLMHGHGMAYKTISFAALILNPLGCELVPVDRHHLKRLGFTDESCSSIRRYLQIEQTIRDERDMAGYEHVPLGVFAWLQWESWRQQTGASKSAGECESHAALSCRNY